jgi:alanyl-tRNA synthetase
MGFERLVRVLQQKQSNYDTDIFSGTISAIENITGKKYAGTDDKKDVAFRVIADHIRAISFTIADGQLPSNTGAGYVIRRILRRAARYYYSYLDYKQPLLHNLIPVLAKQFEHVFPELTSQVEFVSKVVKEEEESFLRTLDKGIRRFSIYTTGVGDSTSGGFAMEKIEDPEEDRKTFLSYVEVDAKERSYKKRKQISGSFAFELNDTYGFPIDLTQLMAREIGWDVNMTEFESALQQQKTRSRSASVVDTEDWIVLDDFAMTSFVGYDSMEIKSKVVKYRKVKSKGNEAYQLVLEATPFYAESGGQVGDTGTLTFDDEVINVVDTKKENDLIVHFIEKLPSKIDAEVLAKVDVSKRKKTETHHSGTHLLHAALRQVLGIHVAQKGSLVNDGQLRFDFSHFAKVTDEEVAQIEAIVNQKIREDIPLMIKEMSKDEAIEQGAMALFGEKYGDIVRVVVMDPSYSIELCGGTHVSRTGEIGYLKIKHETAVAAGVRRIEAVCGNAAEQLINEAFSSIKEIKEALKNPKEISKAIENLQTENNELKKRLEKLEAKQLSIIKDDLLKKVRAENGVQFLGEIVEVHSADALRKLSLDLKNDLNNYVAVLVANVDGKAQVAVSMDDKAIQSKNLDAQKIIKEHIAPIIKGGGGGQKTLATAGGQDASNLQQVIDKVKSLL